ncbi:hypothetical protein [Natronosalvus vescus]|uniref:hypothetical protein n=1 Tax=Natronosalvus vescus TaxID=2953881 RepID=UPI002091C3EB|nr:hypothetical protein [Natronosalvus vescus]
MSYRKYDFSERELEVLKMFIESPSQTITSTDIGQRLGLDHTTQRVRVLRDLEERELIETWQPSERDDNRPIPAPLHAELTVDGKWWLDEFSGDILVDDDIDWAAEWHSQQQEIEELRAEVEELRGKYEREVSRLDSKIEQGEDALETMIRGLADKHGERLSKLERLVDPEFRIEMRNRLDKIDSGMNSLGKSINGIGHRQRLHSMFINKMVKPWIRSLEAFYDMNEWSSPTKTMTDWEDREKAHKKKFERNR